MARLYPLDPPFARSVVARRRALKWSQLRLATEADLTEPHLQKLETLRQGFSPEARHAVEAALARGEREAETRQQPAVAAGGAP